MRPAVVFPDAQSTAADYLRTQLGIRPEPYAAGATVGTRIPGSRSADLPGLPYVMLRQNGPGYGLSFVAARVPVRVVVWHESEDDAHDLAQLALGLLAAHPRVSVDTLPALDADPDTGTPIAFFIVTLSLRSTPIPAV